MKQTFRKILTSIISIVCICTMLFAVACGEEANTPTDSSTTSISSVAPTDSSSAAPTDSSSAAPADSSVEPDDSSVEPDDSSAAADDSSVADDSSSAADDSSSAQEPAELPTPPNYSKDVDVDIVIGAYDGGPAIDKVVLTFEDEIPISAVETRSLVFSWGGDLGNASTDELYLTNARGRKLTRGSSNIVVIEYKVNYSGYGFGNNLSPFSYSGNYNSWKAMSNFNLKMNNFNIDGNVYTNFTGRLNVTRSVPSLEKWDITKSHTKGQVTIKYGTYEPEVPDGEKRPLIIWLHGQGEGNTNGGNDPSIALLGNKVTPLAEDPIQSYFGGAFVLAPQAPTMWMDTTTGTFPASAYQAGTVSKYFEALEELLRTYVSSNSKIDATRVYVGGCSNGGWCTLEVVSRMGNFFAAAYPVCAPYAKGHFSTENFERLTQVPMWIIASNDDTTVNNNGDSNTSVNVDGIAHSKRLYIDMLEGGNQNVYFSLFANVRADGISYMGHFSWIYVFRDEVKNVQAKTGSGTNGAFTKNDYVTNSTRTVQYEGTTVNLWQWLATFKNDGTRIAPLALN